MAEKLKIIPLGGLNEIGKNMTVLEYGKDIIIIDCGLGFPEDDMYGIDLVIADMTYLVKNQEKIRGMFLTHGHEDHIGGIPYAMQQFNCPIHGTRLTAGLVKLKLEEHHLERRVKLFTHEAGEVVKAGCFQVEFIHVNHSIADAVAFAVKTPVGTLVFSGDFKIDAMAEDGMIDLARFGQLGKRGRAGLPVRLHKRRAPGLYALGAQRHRQLRPPVLRLPPENHRHDVRVQCVSGSRAF